MQVNGKGSPWHHCRLMMSCHAMWSCLLSVGNALSTANLLSTRSGRHSDTAHEIRLIGCCILLNIVPKTVPGSTRLFSEPP